MPADVVSLRATLATAGELLGELSVENDQLSHELLETQKQVSRLRSACKAALEDLIIGDCREVTIRVLQEVLS